MSEERPQHDQEPAEGADEDVEPWRWKPASLTRVLKEGRAGQHTEEPAEGSDESVDESGAERSGGNG